MRRILKIAVKVALAIFGIIFVYLAIVFVQVYMAARRDDAKQ